MWEDPQNKNGGKWVVSLKARDHTMDDAWLWTLLAVIGDSLQDSDDITGVVISPRRGQNNRLALWNKTAREEVAKRIGMEFKAILRFSGQVVYQLHSESAKSYATSKTPGKWIL